MAKTVPAPPAPSAVEGVTPLGARTAPDTRVHRCVQHLGIEHANGLHAEGLGKRPARIVVGIRLRIVRRPVLVVEQRVRDAGVRLIHPDDVAARGKLAWFGARRCRRRWPPRPPALSAPVPPPPGRRRRTSRARRARRRGRAAAAGRTGICTVNAAVAREISTRCFCSTRSSSACAPARASLAGST